MITALYLTAGSLDLAVAFWLRRRFSGAGYKTRYAIVLIIYNLYIAAFHMNLAEYGCAFFHGCLQDFHENYPIIAAFAFLCAVLHCLALPVEWTPGRWIRRKFDPRL